MPYSPHYIINQLVKGRPFPSGSPEQDLERALSRYCAVDIDRAFSAGANPSASMQGKIAFHFLIDQATHPKSVRPPNPRQILACVRALVRANVSLRQTDPTSGETVASRLSLLANGATFAEMLHILGRRMEWSAPSGRQDLGTVHDAWLTRVPEDLRQYIPQTTQTVQRPRVR